MYCDTRLEEMETQFQFGQKAPNPSSFVMYNGGGSGGGGGGGSIGGGSGSGGGSSCSNSK